MIHPTTSAFKEKKIVATLDKGFAEICKKKHHSNVYFYVSRLHVFYENFRNP